MGFQAEPAHDFHPTVFPTAIDERLPSEVVIEVDFVPLLIEPEQAILNRGDPDGVRDLSQEDLGPIGVVVEEQDPA
jgi:hypothetical protein